MVTMIWWLSNPNEFGEFFFTWLFGQPKIFPGHPKGGRPLGLGDWGATTNFISLNQASALEKRTRNQGKSKWRF